MFCVKLIILFGFIAINSEGVPTFKNHRRPKLDGRIVGGKKINITDAPYQVSVQQGGHICGGSILSNSWILTAAHCTSGSTAPSFKIRIGSSEHENGGELFAVKEIFQHEQFNYNIIDYDFSLLKLDKELTFSENIQPIGLPNQDEIIEDGTECRVTGWGVTQSPTEQRNVLRVAFVPIVNQEECSEAYQSFGGVTPRMICAGYEEGGKDACQGDSGGPLVQNKTLVGVVSWGYGCARPNYPGVYSRVSSVRDWIKEKSSV